MRYGLRTPLLAPLKMYVFIVQDAKMLGGGYKCVECNRVMRSRQGYIGHLEMHRNPKPVKPKVHVCNAA